MSVKVRIECQNCEAIEEIDCDGVYVLAVKDGKLQGIPHELTYWERLGILLHSLELERARSKTE